MARKPAPAPTQPGVYVAWLTALGADPRLVLTQYDGDVFWVFGDDRSVRAKCLRVVGRVDIPELSAQEGWSTPVAAPAPAPPPKPVKAKATALVATIEPEPAPAPAEPEFIVHTVRPLDVAAAAAAAADTPKPRRRWRDIPINPVRWWRK